MFLNGKENQKERNWSSIVSILFISVIFLSLSSLRVLDGMRDALSYVLDPIHITSSNFANGVGNYFTTFSNISEFRTEYNQMKIDIINYQEMGANYNILKRENEELRSQLELANKEYSYVKAKVLNRVDSDYITINKGLQDGIEKGDVAVFGNTYIGIIIENNQYTSKIRLPTSRSSFLESYITSSNESKEGKILSRSVISGSSEGIRIENIGMNSGVRNGDIVIVNDDKIGENLVLGEIVALSEDPAETTRSGFVSPIIDYYNLINIFVRLKNVD